MVKLRMRTSNKGAAVMALVGLMVALVVGIAVAFQLINDTSVKSTTIYAVTNDTFNASATTGNNTLFRCFNDNHATNCVIDVSTITLYNNTDCASQPFTYTTTYLVLGNGTIPYINFTTLGNIARQNNFTCAEYNYRADTYMSSASARTIVAILPLLFVVGILTTVASFVVL